MSRTVVVDWIERLLKDYGIRDIRFYDDTFTLSKTRLLQFCEELLKRDIHISWSCYSRVDTIDSEMAELMGRSGCFQVKFGIEAGTEESLRKIKKGTSLNQAVRAVKIVKRHGMESKASFMFGIHDETIEDSQSTLDFALKLDPSFAMFQIMLVHPGSTDFERHMKEGKIPVGYKWDKPLLISSRSHEALQELLDKSYQRFYARPQFILRQLVRCLRHGRSQFLRLVHALRYFHSYFWHRTF
jgi:radical SAM superfamily enzyme YgiQ (UPF0313 family)